MTIRPVVILGEPVLHQRAHDVQNFDSALQDLVADLKETNAAAHGAGLAAPQIGVGLRVFVYSLKNDDGVPPEGVVVNPTLVLGKIPGSDPDPESESEGCLSVPGYHLPLKRADWVRVTGFDEFGKALEFEATGWFARCMQHETDHLEGKLYVDRLIDKYQRQVRKIVRKQEWGVPGQSWLPGVDKDPFGH